LNLWIEKHFEKIRRKMMRLFIVKALMVGLLLFSASSASAINLFMANLTAVGPLQIGDTFSIQLRLNTEGETGINLLYASTQTSDPSVVSFVSGVSPAAILVTFTTSGVPVSVARNAQPQDGVPGDAAGRVRAASFGSPDPSGGSSANQLLSTLTFVATGAGTTSIAPLVETMTAANNDRVDVNGVNVTASVTTGPGLEVTVVPEPGTALLMGLGLAGLGVAGRRKA
jgi:hypothetical protein